MPTEYTLADEISYRASNWCYDLMKLKHSPLDDGQCLQTVYWKDIANASKRATIQSKFDKIFTITKQVLLAVQLSEKRVVSFSYRSTPRFIFDQFQYPDSGNWIDAACIASGFENKWEGRYNFSIYILTDQNELIVFEMEPYSNMFHAPYHITINSKHQYTRLVGRESGEINTFGTNSRLYLWTPKKKMLQQFEIKQYSQKEHMSRSIPENCQGVAEPVPYMAFKIKAPKLNGVELPYDGTALTLSVDGYRNSALCADAKNHILFEHVLGSSSSTILCGLGRPGCMEKEDIDTWTALINTPCAPMVFRPQEFVSKDQFKSSTWDMLNAGTDPRIVLLCDSGNHAVRKIWQFPKNSYADDLSNLNRIYTLLRQDENERAKRKKELLQLPCNGPKAFYVNPCGILTVTTADCAHILCSTVAVVDEKAMECDISTS